MLVTSSDTLRDYARVQYNFNIKNATPWLRRAERNFLRPVLGQELLDALIEYDETSASGGVDPDVLDDLLALAQEAEVLFAMVDLGDVLQVNLSDMGMQVQVTDTHKTPYKWQVANWKEGYHQAGLTLLEEILAFLNDHRDDFTEWAGSPADLRANDLLLRTTDEFDRVLAIGGSNVTYSDLRAAIRRAQTLELVPVLGAAFVAELIDHQSDLDGDSGSASAEASWHEQAIAQLQPALAELAIFHAKEVSFRRVNGGLLSTRWTVDQEVNADEAGNSFSDITRRNAYNTGQALLAVARQWLDANAAHLPTYADGPGYRAAGADEIPTEDRFPKGSNTMMM